MPLLVHEVIFISDVLRVGSIAWRRVPSITGISGLAEGTLDAVRPGCGAHECDNALLVVADAQGPSAVRRILLQQSIDTATSCGRQLLVGDIDHRHMACVIPRMSRSA
jgi:hypothetical protein